MINKHLVCTFIIAVSVSVSNAPGQFREPNYAPAEQGVIASPRIVTKAPRTPNRDLIETVTEAIDISSRRYLVANEHSPWQIYHGLNAYRRDFMLDLDGKLVPAVDWLSTTNPYFRGLPWFEKTVHGGRAHKFTSPYHFEGHPNQSLALMVMCNLPLDHKFQTDGGPITVQDIVNNAKADLNPREELTWTLWFLTHYLGSEETWMTRRGETWSIEKLVANQIETQVTKAACGGTHNLYALAAARNNHVRRGGQIRGVWMQADQKINRYLVAARSLQRPDGSFPTNYFRGYGYPKSFSEQIASTGHMMEWIVVAANKKQLNDPWIENGIRYIAERLIQYRDESAECGPLYHAVSALVLYRERVTGVEWPRHDVQPTSPTKTPEASPLANAPEKESAAPTKTAENFPTPVRIDDQKLDAKPIMPKQTAEKPADVSKQAQKGTLSIGIEEDLLREPKETAPVERLAAPDEGTIVQ